MRTPPFSFVAPPFSLVTPPFSLALPMPPLATPPSSAKPLEKLSVKPLATPPFSLASAMPPWAMQLAPAKPLLPPSVFFFAGGVEGQRTECGGAFSEATFSGEISTGAAVLEDPSPGQKSLYFSSSRLLVQASNFASSEFSSSFSSSVGADFARRRFRFVAWAALVVNPPLESTASWGEQWHAPHAPARPPVERPLSVSPLPHHWTSRHFQ